jgi:four helix bundle protein
MAEFGFEKLKVYQAARAFRSRIYKLSRLLPQDEKFNLASQLKRAALSVTNNIAEGHGRFTYKDRIHFCLQSRGSLLELVDDINACIDEGYAKTEHLEGLRNDAFELLRILTGYIRFLKAKKNEST